MGVRILAIYTDKERIKEILYKIINYSFDDLSKHPHFDFSVLEKATDENLLRQTFPRFELIKSIELRENEKGQRHYGFNYELDNGTFVVIVLALDKIPPVILNGYHKNRNYKEFERNLRKYYNKKFI